MIVLDGVLDEPVWRRAVHGGEFIQQDPVLGAQPTERTGGPRVAFNRDHLYIGVICFDSEPDKLQGNTSKRDEFLGADDRFMWTMDTFPEPADGLLLRDESRRPDGRRADGAGRQQQPRVGRHLNARVRQSEIGWTIEIDIPFRSIAFDPNAPAWGINFQRTVRRKQEELLWTGHQRNQGLRRMANAGLLVGLSDVSAGRGFELRPYASGFSATEPGAAPRETAGDLGIDLAYNITPSLRGVATVNTDFAETEVDQRLVNLTRFPLFFPERRTFFLDGATFFDLPQNAFFSRRIGLVAGIPQTIVGGGKLTGQAGQNDLGALYVRTAETADAPSGDFLAGRRRRRILQQSFPGVLHGPVHQRRRAGPLRQTAADFRLATATSSATRTWRCRGSGWPTRPTMGRRERGVRGRHRLPERHLGRERELPGGAAQLRPGRRLHAASRVPALQPRFSWNPVRRRGTASSVRWGSALPGALHGSPEPQAVHRLPDPDVPLEMHSGDNVQVNVSPSYERLDDPFGIADEVILPGGSEYQFLRYSVSLNTANRRVVALRPRVEWGTFFSGERTEYQLGVDVRPRPGVRVNTTLEHNVVTLAEGRFDTTLLRTVLDTQFSPFMFMVNNVQYDSVSRVLGWQARFRWILTPGNDLFVIYTHNWLDGDDDPLSPRRGWRTLNTRAAAKFVYTKRF